MSRIDVQENQITPAQIVILSFEYIRKDFFATGNEKEAIGKIPPTLC